VPDHGPTPSQAALWNETWRRALNRLPAEERRVALLLRDGWGVPEIAAETGIDEGSVRRLRVRALSELGAALARAPLD
jgi:DNA-directed RNA polymerase specialized sigma24 family protein